MPQKKQFILYTLLGLGIAAFNLIPSFYYLKILRLTYVENNTRAILDNLVPLQRLVIPDFAINAEKPFSSLFLPIIIFGLILIYVNKKSLHGKKLWSFIFFGLISLAVYLFMADSAKTLWLVTLPISGILQVPTRLFTILSFTIPFFVGLYIPLLINKFIRWGLTVIIIFISLSSLSVFKPVEYSYFYEYSAEGKCATTTWQDEYLPVWVRVCPPKEMQKNLILEGDGKLEITKNSLLNMEAIVINKKPADLIVHRYYFPGWDVYVDGQKSKLNYTFSSYGIFKTKIPEGKHKINVVYRKTPVMIIADLISLFSILTLIVIVFKNLFKVAVFR